MIEIDDKYFKLPTTISATINIVQFACRKNYTYPKNCPVVGIWKGNKDTIYGLRES